MDHSATQAASRKLMCPFVVDFTMPFEYPAFECVAILLGDVWLWVSYLVVAAQIAMKELREKKIPFTVRRYLPDGRCVSKEGPMSISAEAMAQIEMRAIQKGFRVSGSLESFDPLNRALRHCRPTQCRSVMTHLSPAIAQARKLL